MTASSAPAPCNGSCRCWAYANIGHNQGKTWYLAQIPAGLEHLRKLLPGSTLAEPLAAMLA